MKVMFLGTSAATAVPLPFCRCDMCVSARKNGGKDLRMRSSVLIDDHMLIDLGPDLTTAAGRFGVDISEIDCLIQTHSHSDHFDPGHMITRIPDYACVSPQNMTIAAGRRCLVHMSEKLSREEEGATLLNPEWRKKLGVNVIPLTHGDRIAIGGYEIIAVESAHDTLDDSLMYIVRKGSSAFFYACDTPLLTERAWALIESIDFPITAAAIDQCYGPNTPGGGHMNADQCSEFAARIGCKTYATHISHEGTPNHAELEKWTRAHGYETAYDGLTLYI